MGKIQYKISFRRQGHTSSTDSLYPAFSPLDVVTLPIDVNMAVQQPEPVPGVGSPVPAHNTDPIDEKFQSHHMEYEKVEVKGDYSGAVAKTSPEEKKLVRKLDIWIMVSQLSAYLPNPTKYQYSPCSGSCTGSIT